MRGLEEVFVSGEDGESIAETLAVAKPDLPTFAARRSCNADLARISRVRFDRLSTETARPPSYAHHFPPRRFDLRRDRFCGWTGCLIVDHFHGVVDRPQLAENRPRSCEPGRLRRLGRKSEQHDVGHAPYSNTQPMRHESEKRHHGVFSTMRRTVAVNRSHSRKPMAPAAHTPAPHGCIIHHTRFTRERADTSVEPASTPAAPTSGS